MIIKDDKLCKLDKKDIDKALDILGEAFANYAFPSMLIKDDSSRRSFVREMLKFEVKYCQRRGNAYTLGAEFKEISLWHDSWRPVSKFQYFSCFSFSSLRMFKLDGKELKTIQQSASFLDKAKKSLKLSDNTAELVVIGVLPSAQGEGRAAKMIRTALSELKAEGKNCIVVTNTEKNKGIYQKLGFTSLYDEVDSNGIRFIILYFDCNQ
ncbi:N-acetyltransferase [bacterium]|nr:N-acetyltransferase [bacterium]